MPFTRIEGYGANVVGGTGGRIITVTNLNDGGSGSLREAIETLGSRTVQFDIDGIIELESPLHIVVGNGFLTIDGSTAPCGGICLKNEGIRISAQEVILKQFRIRPGPDAIDPGNNDCITIQNSDILIANMSLSWATDEIITCTGGDVSNITIQWCIISEGITPTYFGAFVTNFADKISFHHNLLAHINDRMPTINGGKVDVRNNVIYNARDLFQINPTTSPALVNVVGNIYIPGPDTTASAYVNPEPGAAFEAESKIYLQDNRDQNRIGDDQPENACVTDGRQNSVMFVEDEISMPVITTTKAPTAKSQILAFAGAILPKRDVIDEHIVENVRSGTGQIIDNPSEVGGWPDLALVLCPEEQTDRSISPWLYDRVDEDDNEYVEVDGLSIRPWTE